MAYSGNSFNSGRGAESSDSYANIPQNRTLFAEKLTQDAPLIPAIVQNLETIENVFAHYQPGVEVTFDTPDGGVKKEKFVFNTVDDFGLDKIIERSKVLRQSLRERDQYLKMMKQLKSNTILKALLADVEGRNTLIDAINCMRAELNQSK